MADFDVASSISGTLDVGLDDIHVREVAKITTESTVDVGLGEVRVKELPVIRLESSIKELPKIITESKVDLGLDDIRVKELPKFEVEFSVKPVRVHLPGHHKVCISIFGVEVFSLAVCGESMVVAEPYLPHKTEVCR